MAKENFKNRVFKGSHTANKLAAVYYKSDEKVAENFYGRALEEENSKLAFPMLPAFLSIVGNTFWKTFRDFANTHYGIVSGIIFALTGAIAVPILIHIDHVRRVSARISQATTNDGEKALDQNRVSNEKEAAGLRNLRDITTARIEEQYGLLDSIEGANRTHDIRGLTPDQKAAYLADRFGDMTEDKVLKSIDGEKVQLVRIIELGVTAGLDPQKQVAIRTIRNMDALRPEASITNFLTPGIVG